MVNRQIYFKNRSFLNSLEAAMCAENILNRYIGAEGSSCLVIFENHEPSGPICLSKVPFFNLPRYSENHEPSGPIYLIKGAKKVGSLQKTAKKTTLHKEKVFFINGNVKMKKSENIKPSCFLLCVVFSITTLKRVKKQLFNMVYRDGRFVILNETTLSTFLKNSRFNKSYRGGRFVIYNYSRLK